MTPTTEATSEPTSPSNATEETENSKTGIYIAVSVTIITVLLIVFAVYILIRKLQRKQPRENNESEAIYLGNDLPRRNRHSVPGIENQAYCTHKLESGQEHSDGVMVISNCNHCKEPTRVPAKPDARKFENVEFKTTISVDNCGYNHIKLSNKNSHNTSYSCVTSCPGGFKIVNDDDYSHLANKEKENCGNGTSTDKYLKSNVANPGLYDKYETISCHFEVQSSVYDHALSGGPDSENNIENEYNHLKPNADKETYKIARPNSYENVSKEHEHGFIPSGENNDIVFPDNADDLHIEEDNFSYLKDKQGNETSIIQPYHKYENVRKEHDGMRNKGTQDRLGGYEEPVGCTPNYFVVEP